MKNSFKKIFWVFIYFCAVIFSLFLAIGFFGFIALIFQFDFGTDFFEIDTCLDQGGRWNEKASICEYE